MKKLALIGLLACFIGISTISQSGSEKRAGNKDERFIGSWRLVSLEEPDANGNVHRADCTGLLVYTLDGHMSVQVMYQDPQRGVGAAPVQYAQGGYEASYGRYEIDDAHAFTFHVEGALVRTLVGKDLKRVYEFSGKQLIVKSSNPNENWRVTWERY